MATSAPAQRPRLGKATQRFILRVLRDIRQRIDLTPYSAQHPPLGPTSHPPERQAAATTGHTYTSAGTYQASVTVTNNFGNSSAAYVPIQVSTSVTVTPANGPVAELVLSPNQGAAPLTVTLDIHGKWTVSR